MLEPVKKSDASNFIFYKDNFYLKNIKTQLYVNYDPNTFFLYNKIASPDKYSIFHLQFNNAYYSLLNDKNNVLALYDNNLIKFIPEKQITSNEHLFKLNIQYLIIYTLEDLK